MMPESKIEVKEIKWDRIARKAVIYVGGKAILIPSFSPYISSESELELVIESLGIYTMDHVKMLIMGLHKAEKLKSIIQSSRFDQLTIDEKVANEYEKSFVKNVTKMYDPCSEYTFYEEKTDEVSKSPLTQIDLKRVLIQIQNLHEKKKKRKISNIDHDTKVKNLHENFWRKVASDDKLRMRLITDTFKQETLCGANIGLPPVPLIYNEESLNTTIEINRTARLVWNDDNCATYLILQSTVFSSESLMNKIRAYISQVPTKFIVIKIKNFEIDTRDKIEQRTEYKKLLETIIQTKHRYKDERVFMLLEAGHQFYPSAASGFDIVSTSLRGIDKDFSNFGKRRKLGGGMLDIHTLTIRNSDEVTKMIRNKTWRCKCEICKNLTEEAMDAMVSKNWIDARRVHYLLAVNNLLIELADYIEKQKIEFARNKVKDSAISNLKQIFPIIDESVLVK